MHTNKDKGGYLRHLGNNITFQRAKSPLPYIYIYMFTLNAINVLIIKVPL
jgi:hypothetical protein